MKNRVSSRYAGLAAAAVLAVVSATPGLAQEVSFAGKTVRILINFGPGSSTDVLTRQFAPFVAKYMPGKPTLIVESKPGGRGLLGAAFMFKNVKPDGLTLGGLALVVPRMAMAKVPVDVRKFVHVGGIGVSAVFYTRQDTGIATAADLKTTDKKIIMAGVGPNVPNVLQLKLLFNAIGQKNFQLIPGYKGQLGMLKAVRSNEVNLGFMIANVWMPRRANFAKEGVVRGLMESGVNDAAGSPRTTLGLGLPTMESQWRAMAPGTMGTPAYRAFSFLQSTRTLLFVYVLPPGTPAKFAAAWEEAMTKGLRDPEYLAVLDKISAPYPMWSSGATAKRIIDDIAKNKNDPEIQAALNKVKVKR
jgi:putative tricarboxylic transport membrane protein